MIPFNTCQIKKKNFSHAGHAPASIHLCCKLYRNFLMFFLGSVFARFHAKSEPEWHSVKLWPLGIEVADTIHCAEWGCTWRSEGGFKEFQFEDCFIFFPLQCIFHKGRFILVWCLILTFLEFLWQSSINSSSEVLIPSIAHAETPKKGRGLCFNELYWLQLNDFK